jgi:aspartate carbamoyltransferase catalytic subunit
MHNKSLISITDFSKEDYLRIMELAADFEKNPDQKLLEGKSSCLLILRALNTH